MSDLGRLRCAVWEGRHRMTDDRPDVAALAEALLADAGNTRTWYNTPASTLATRWIAALPEGWHLTNDTGQIAALRAALEAVEWLGWDGARYCLKCKWSEGKGHASDCIIGQALTDTAEAAAPRFAEARSLDRAHDEAIEKPWREALRDAYALLPPERVGLIRDTSRALLERKP